MRDITVGSYDDNAAVPIDLANSEYICSTAQIRTEYFLVVAKLATTLLGKKESRHIFDLQIAVFVLEHSTHVYDGVDICPARRIASYWRMRGDREEFA